MRLSGVIFLLFVGLWGQAQTRYTISGEVLDADSQETLIGVTLLVPELNTGTVTNAYGFYSLTLPEGEYSLVVQYLGYKTQMLSLSINQGSKLDIRLEISSEALEEVVVTDDIERINIKKPRLLVLRIV